MGRKINWLRKFGKLRIIKCDLDIIKRWIKWWNFNRERKYKLKLK
jgi:hypothetical protein